MLRSWGCIFTDQGSERTKTRFDQTVTSSATKPDACPDRTLAYVRTNCDKNKDIYSDMKTDILCLDICSDLKPNMF